MFFVPIYVLFYKYLTKSPCMLFAHREKSKSCFSLRSNVVRRIWWLSIFFIHFSSNPIGIYIFPCYCIWFLIRNISNGFFCLRNNSSLDKVMLTKNFRIIAEYLGIMMDFGKFNKDEDYHLFCFKKSVILFSYIQGIFWYQN